MERNNSIIEYKKYGMVTIHLADVMDQKGINRYTLAKTTGVRYEVVNKWYTGNIERADLDVLAKFCYVLNCQINDILTYVYE